MAGPKWDERPEIALRSVRRYPVGALARTPSRCARLPMQLPHALVNGTSRSVRRSSDALRCVAMSTYALDRAARIMQKTAMSFRTRLMLTAILAALVGCHAYLAFIVLPAAYADLPKSQLKFSGD